jgi:hypothetical protein
MAGGALAAAVIAIVLVRRRRRGRGDGSGRAPRRRDRDPVSQTYLAALRTLGRRGFPRGTSATPREHARSLVGSGAPGAAALTELCELYYAAEWSGVPSDDKARDRAQLLSSQIQDALRNVKKRKR